MLSSSFPMINIEEERTQQFFYNEVARKMPSL